tara:strand:+ start:1901 stop:3676 length:1776 start_codon:yes stop_codon:yes gene_type:complete
MHKLIDLHIHDGHNSSVLVIDHLNGDLLFGANEERFTRQKNQGGFPYLALKKSKEHLKFSSSDVKKIFFSTKTVPYFANQKTSIFRKIFLQLNFHLPKSFFTNKLITKLYLNLSHKKRKKDLKEVLKKIGLSKAELCFFDHHLCHCASILSFCNETNNKELLLFTLDGSGDALSGSITVFKKNKFKILKQIHTLDSLGEIYSQATALLNMKPMEHEYKLMGLAPYCKEEFAQKVKETIKEKLISLKLDKCGKYTFTSKTGKWGASLRKYMSKIFANYRFDAIAGGSQLFLEEEIVKWIKKWVKETGIRNIGLSGGVFMNVKVNMLITEMPEINSTTVVPSSGDESLVFGSWVLANLKNLKNNESQKLKLNSGLNSGLLIGNKYDEKYLLALIKKIKNTYKNDIEVFEDKSNKKASILLSKGKIGARFAGSMEFGARSLGNRSIICSPHSINQISLINEAIKSRDFWMPFAPVILDGDVIEYFKIENKFRKNYQFMQIAARSTEKAQKNAPAILHPYDKTARPQVLYKEMNPSFYALILKFKDLSNIPCLLNTSFNLHGHPVVESPEQALDVFIKSGLDFLIFENYCLTKTT